MLFFVVINVFHRGPYGPSPEKQLYPLATCADPESFVRGGPTLTFFLVYEGREDPSTIIRGPSSVRQRNAIKWRLAGVPMMAQH